MSEKNRYIESYKKWEEVLNKRAILGITTDIESKEAILLIKDVELMSYIASKYTKKELYDRKVELEIILDDWKKDDLTGRYMISNTLEITQAVILMYNKLKGGSHGLH